VTTCPTDDVLRGGLLGSQANFIPGCPGDMMSPLPPLSLMQTASTLLAKVQDARNLHLTDSTATEAMSDSASEDGGCGPSCSGDHGNPEFYDSAGGEVYPSLALSANTMLHVDHTQQLCSHN
jgi:hypothetical protein